ncbi:MAG: diacylglycerol kinase family protein [Bacteroides sp.]|nr:diacylglycerol kinase family protein [Bacteroides sp.]
MKYDLKKQIRSFGYAWQGIRSCVGREQNLGFHLLAAIVAVVLGCVCSISKGEWIAVVGCIGAVVSAELFNTAIEKLVDYVSPARHPLAGQVKDIAAGAVLVCATAAAVIGAIIFLPYLTRCFR